ncbi:MAG TPA: hypothetical protein VHU15_18550, partial [Stellaceae bacterium]|nr:hypothetical protein [Stellaceae bacterium]
GKAMKNCRERALILLEVAERTAHPEHKAKVAAPAEAWLTFAAKDNALTLWAVPSGKWLAFGVAHSPVT